MSSRSLPSFIVALSLAAFCTSALSQDPAQAPAPTQDPAPIVHQYAPNQRAMLRPPQPPAPPPIALTSPSPGIWVRSAPGAEVKTVATTADSIELRVDKGLANISIRQAKDNQQILVDLPGGQVALFKDGVYTFNAGTNTFRVLEGEAAAFPATDPKAKPLTVKEDHAVVFGAGNLKSVEFAPFQAQADILPAGSEGRGPGYGREPGYGGYGNGPYGYGPGYYGPAYAYGPYGGWGPYGDGFYASPYYAWGYPYGWGGWGYPYGFGLGFGFGGYWGGGFGRGFGFRR